MYHCLIANAWFSLGRLLYKLFAQNSLIGVVILLAVIIAVAIIIIKIKQNL